MKHRPFGRTGKTDDSTVPDRSCAITQSVPLNTPTSTASAASPVGVRDAETSTAAGAKPAAERLLRICSRLGCGDDASRVCRAASTARGTPEAAAVAEPDGDVAAVAWDGTADTFSADAGASLTEPEDMLGEGAEHADIPISSGKTATASPTYRRPRGRRSWEGSREVTGTSSHTGSASKRPTRPRPRAGHRQGVVHRPRAGMRLRVSGVLDWAGVDWG